MPKRGEFAELDPGLPVERRELAEAVRGLLRRIGLSCQATSEQLLIRAGGAGFLSRPVLSALASGQRKRVPREAPLRALHTLALNSKGTQGTVCSWETLDGLRRALSPLPTVDEQGTAVCPLCGADAPLERAISEAVRPADAAPATATDVAPVPRQQGDRRNIGTVDFSWAPTEDLVLYLAAGNLERANGLIRHAGSGVHPGETADAVVSCRDADLPEATEAILDYAGRRTERDILQIIHSLNRHERRADADTLLERALVNSGSLEISGQQRSY